MTKSSRLVFISILLLLTGSCLYAELSIIAENESSSAAIEKVNSSVYILHIATPNEEGVSINKIKWNLNPRAVCQILINNQTYERDLDYYQKTVLPNSNLDYAVPVKKVVFIVESQGPITFPFQIKSDNAKVEKIEVEFICNSSIRVGNLALEGISSLSISTLGGFDFQKESYDDFYSNFFETSIAFYEPIENLNANLRIATGSVEFKSNYGNSQNTEIKAFRVFSRKPGIAINCRENAHIQGGGLNFQCFGKNAGMVMQGLSLSDDKRGFLNTTTKFIACGNIQIKEFWETADIKPKIESKNGLIIFQNAVLNLGNGGSFRAKTIENYFSYINSLGGKLEYNADVIDNSTGAIKILGTAEFNSKKLFNQTGSVEAVGKVSLNCDEIKNAAASIKSDDEINIQTEKIVNQGGTIHAKKSLNISTNEFHQVLMMFQADSQKVFYEGSISAPIIELTVKDIFKNEGGVIYVGDSLKITSGSFFQFLNLPYIGISDLDNYTHAPKSGVFASNGLAEIKITKVGDFKNAASIESDNSIEIECFNDFDNSGKIAARNEININGNRSITNQLNGTIVASKILIDIPFESSKRALTNYGFINAGNISLSVPLLNNYGDIECSLLNLCIDEIIENIGTISFNNYTWNSSTLINEGTIISGDSFEPYLSENFFQTQTATISAPNVRITVDGKVEDNGTYDFFDSSGTLHLIGSQVNFNGNASPYAAYIKGTESLKLGGNIDAQHALYDSVDLSISQGAQITYHGCYHPIGENNTSDDGEVCHSFMAQKMKNEGTIRAEGISFLPNITYRFENMGHVFSSLFQHYINPALIVNNLGTLEGQYLYGELESFLSQGMIIANDPSYLLALYTSGDVFVKATKGNGYIKLDSQGKVHLGKSNTTNIAEVEAVDGITIENVHAKNIKLSTLESVNVLGNISTQSLNDPLHGKIEIHSKDLKVDTAVKIHSENLGHFETKNSAQINGNISSDKGIEYYADGDTSGNGNFQTDGMLDVNTQGNFHINSLKSGEKAFVKAKNIHLAGELSAHGIGMQSDENILIDGDVIVDDLIELKGIEKLEISGNIKANAMIANGFDKAHFNGTIALLNEGNTERINALSQKYQTSTDGLCLLSVNNAHFAKEVDAKRLLTKVDGSMTSDVSALITTVHDNVIIAGTIDLKGGLKSEEGNSGTHALLGNNYAGSVEAKKDAFVTSSQITKISKIKAQNAELIGQTVETDTEQIDSSLTVMGNAYQNHISHQVGDKFTLIDPVYSGIGLHLAEEGKHLAFNSDNVTLGNENFVFIGESMKFKDVPVHLKSFRAKTHGNTFENSAIITFDSLFEYEGAGPFVNLGKIQSNGTAVIVADSFENRKCWGFQPWKDAERNYFIAKYGPMWTATQGHNARCTLGQNNYNGRNIQHPIEDTGIIQVGSLQVVANVGDIKNSNGGEIYVKGLDGVCQFFANNSIGNNYFRRLNEAGVHKNGAEFVPAIISSNVASTFQATYGSITNDRSKLSIDGNFNSIANKDILFINIDEKFLYGYDYYKYKTRNCGFLGHDTCPTSECTVTNPIYKTISAQGDGNFNGPINIEAIEGDISIIGMDIRLNGDAYFKAGHDILASSIKIQNERGVGGSEGARGHNVHTTAPQQVRNALEHPGTPLPNWHSTAGNGAGFVFGGANVYNFGGSTHFDAGNNICPRAVTFAAADGLYMRAGNKIVAEAQQGAYIDEEVNSGSYHRTTEAGAIRGSNFYAGNKLVMNATNAIDFHGGGTYSGNGTLLWSPTGKISQYGVVQEAVTTEEITKKKFFGLMKSTVKTKYNHPSYDTTKHSSGDEITAVSEENYMEGTCFFTPSNITIISKHVVIKPLVINLFLEQEQTSSGIRFPGISQIVFDLANGDYNSRSVVNNIDMLRSIDSALKARSATDLANPMNTGWFLYNQADQAAQVYQETGGDLGQTGKSVAMSNLGLTENGLPSGIGFYKTTTRTRMTDQEVVPAAFVTDAYAVIKAERADLNALRIYGGYDIDAKQLNILPTKTTSTYECEQKTNSVASNWNSNSIRFAYSEGKDRTKEIAESYVYSYFGSNDKSVFKFDDGIIENAVIEGPNTVVNGKNLVMRTIQETKHRNSKSTGWSAGLTFTKSLIIPDFGLSYGRNHYNKNWAGVPTTLNATHLEMDVKNLTLRGAAILGEEGYVNADEFHYSDLEDTEKEKGWFFSINTNVLTGATPNTLQTSTKLNANNFVQAAQDGASYLGKAITGAISVGSDYFSRLGITRATVAPGFEFNVKSGDTNVNRDVGKMQEVLGEKRRVASLMIPITTPARIRESNEKIGQMFRGMREKMNSRFAQAKMEAKTGGEREAIDSIKTQHEEQQSIIENMMLSEDEKMLAGQVLDEFTMNQLAQHVSEYREQSGDEKKMEWFDEFRKGKVPTNSHINIWESAAEDENGVNMRVVYVRKTDMKILLNAQPELMVDKEGGFNVRGVSYDEVTKKITFRALRDNEFLSIETDLASLMKLRTAHYMVAVSDGVQDVLDYWNQSPNMRLVASTFLDCVPVLGNAKAVSELWVGRDYTHNVEDYNGWDYTFTIIGTVIPGGKHLRKAGKVLDIAVDGVQAAVGSVGKLLRVATTAEVLESIPDLEKLIKTLGSRDLGLLKTIKKADSVPVTDLLHSQKGLVGELKAMQTLSDRGYDVISSKYNNVHGLDMIGIKWKGMNRMEEILKNLSKILTYADEIQEIIVYEAKYSKDGIFNGLKQLEMAEIEKRVVKMAESERPIVQKLGKLLTEHRSDLLTNARREGHVVDATNTVKTIIPKE